MRIDGTEIEKPTVESLCSVRLQYDEYDPEDDNSRGYEDEVSSS